MESQKRRRVTLQDVAKHSGVSRATASLVVRNSPSISHATREKVLTSMKELGYVYDRIAANLRSQSSSTIGIIITDVANTFYSELLIGVNQELEKYGFTVLLGTTFDVLDKQEKLLSTMLEHRVGGIILCPVSSSGEETVTRISALDIPVVLAMRELPEMTCDYVGIDYKSGAQMAVNHLLKKGHKRIAFIGGRSEASTWKQRMEGYSLALQESNIDIDQSIIMPGAPTQEGGMEAIKKILQIPEPERPTAIFCFNDLTAFGINYGLRKAGITPGKVFDLVGFDNTPESEIFHPPLTTVSSFAKLIGKKAAELLHGRLTDKTEEQQKIIVQPELIVRD
ncbi:LacI family DNA-binding transcriptional regulator [Sporosarcina luteola]|uniref:LacI family DNA-binding transcriptional regulator n=1 Tax=Sporosarcina luteola TaxID=582850 RepID=UPI002040B618|nr:LacI family DNA-binding transcriptional regulator [Sporosarcina luteola]MCM3711897.1 LacI family DNA-binding transcriptional regulator [Sporosarcina luteola]